MGEEKLEEELWEGLPLLALNPSYYPTRMEKVYLPLTWFFCGKGGNKQEKVRVIAGLAKGRHLKAPPGDLTRPTADRVRESIFNILAKRCMGAKVLDLFAGAGTLGIEALSRGAAEAVFVEQNHRAVEIIRENLRQCDFGDVARVIAKDVFRGLAVLSRKGEHFDLIFLDPPYGRGLAARTLQELGEGRLLAPQGMVIAEHSRHDPLAERYGLLHLVRAERYGETMVSFYNLDG